MNQIYAVVLFLVVISSTSSTLCVSLSDNDGDQTTMHDAGIELMTQANPVQTGTFLLEERKLLTLSRKSSPDKNCIDLGQPCGLLDHCCDPYYCDGYIAGTCKTTYCQRTGLPCLPFTSCCGFCVAEFCVG